MCSPIGTLRVHRYIGKPFGDGRLLASFNPLHTTEHAPPAHSPSPPIESVVRFDVCDSDESVDAATDTSAGASP